jgi:hypothetical protein
MFDLAELPLQLSEFFLCDGAVGITHKRGDFYWRKGTVVLD